jgi:excinuclease ABC subunit B
MEQAAKELDFIIAAKLRDEIKSYQSKLLDLKE